MILLLFGLFTYFINALPQDCIANCSGHGICTGTTCMCVEGYTGIDCSIALDTLQPGVEVAGSVEAWGWHYYVISNPKKRGSYYNRYKTF
jgi:hypothetical protein